MGDKGWYLPKWQAVVFMNLKQQRHYRKGNNNICLTIGQIYLRAPRNNTIILAYPQRSYYDLHGLNTIYFSTGRRWGGRHGPPRLDGYLVDSIASQHSSFHSRNLSFIPTKLSCVLIEIVIQKERKTLHNFNTFD